MPDAAGGRCDSARRRYIECGELNELSLAARLAGCPLLVAPHRAGQSSGIGSQIHRRSPEADKAIGISSLGGGSGPVSRQTVNIIAERTPAPHYQHGGSAASTTSVGMVRPSATASRGTHRSRGLVMSTFRQEDGRPCPALAYPARALLPRFMKGRTGESLGARATVSRPTLFASGSNERDDGHAVYSGCFRMTNGRVDLQSCPLRHQCHRQRDPPSIAP